MLVLATVVERGTSRDCTDRVREAIRCKCVALSIRISASSADSIVSHPLAQQGVDAIKNERRVSLEGILCRLYGQNRLKAVNDSRYE